MYGIKIKTLFFAFLVLCVVLVVSCEKNPVEEYGDALISSYEKGKVAKKVADLKTLKEAVQIYRTTNGYYPGELKDLESLIGSTVDYELYEYNPQTGEVKLKN